MVSIMIVEDDEVIASSLEKELTKWSYEAFQATDFNRVLETYLDKQPENGLPYDKVIPLIKENVSIKMNLQSRIIIKKCP